MSAGLVVTSTTGEAEGTGATTSSGEANSGDQLKAMFTQNPKLDLEWHDKLVEEGIEYDDLLDSAEDDIRSMLRDCNLKAKAVSRIINAVRKIPESITYQILNSTKISIVSTEEQNATLKIQKESAKTMDSLTLVVNTLQTLDKNTKMCEKGITDSFNNIIQRANQRKKELLQQLIDIKQTKYNHLLGQQNTLKDRVTELERVYNQTQSMIKDASWDAEKRKIKILSDTEKILNQQMESDLQLITDGSIDIKIDTNSINDKISSVGSVYDETGALPPHIKISKVSFNTAFLILNPVGIIDECIEYKLEHIETDSHNSDEKLDWETVTIKAKNISESVLSLALDNKSVKYEIASLKRATKYMVRAATLNNNGWGLFSQTVEFETNNIDPKPFVAPFMVFDLFGTASSRMSIVAFSQNRKVKCIKGAVSSSFKCFGSSIRMKYAMPIEKRGNNKYSIASISWQIRHTATKTFPNVYYFIGVVSNRTKDLSMIACKGLVDAYGISGHATKVYRGRNTVMQETDANYSIQYQKNTMVTVEYRVRESQLNFYNESNEQLYTMVLPHDISEITDWYPCVSLRDKDDICQVSSNVIVK